jgi:hypothetical protein
MSNQAARMSSTEEERQQRLGEMNADLGTDWSEGYKPGTFGCHELLDRASLLGDIVEKCLLTHPACALNREWYALAEQAVAALRELYQRIGSEHLEAESKSAVKA